MRRSVVTRKALTMREDSRYSLAIRAFGAGAIMGRAGQGRRVAKGTMREEPWSNQDAMY